MTSNNREAEKPVDNKGDDVRPLAGKNPKLEDKIADEKDEQLLRDKPADQH
jgi:hypothetical protein